MQNIFEYALGGHPTSKRNAVDILPKYSLVDNSDGRHLSLTYRRRSGGGIGNTASGYAIDGITYYVQTNNSLSDTGWQTTSNRLVEVGSPLYHGDCTESVTVRMQEPIDSSAKPSAFMRLKIECDE